MLRVRERLGVLRVCDRVGAGDDRIRFTSAILPPMSASTIALMKGGLGRGACPSAQARSVEQALRRHLCARGWHMHGTREHAVVARTATRPETARLSSGYETIAMPYLPSMTSRPSTEVSAHDQPSQEPIAFCWMREIFAAFGGCELSQFPRSYQGRAQSSC